jgi:predicted AAA+ superfamily ATPase
VARPTVQGYFDALTDTRIGSWLPAWRPRAKVKEVAHPKFYLFDCGAARALAHRRREPLEGAERGALLETLVFHELRSQIAYAGCGGELSYYRTPSGSEVDFIWVRGKHAVGIEVKASPRWRQEYGRALAELQRPASSTPAMASIWGTSPFRTDRYASCRSSRSCSSFAQAACSGHLPVDEFLETGVENRRVGH